MGYLDDLNSIIKSVTSVRDVVKSRDSKSFARGALDGTIQFPALMSDTSELNLCTVAVRSLDRIYASFVQTYLSMNSTVDISVDKNPMDFIKRMHQNIKLESTGIDVYFEHCVDSDIDTEDMMERVHNGRTQIYFNDDKTRAIAFSFNDEWNHEIMESMQSGYVNYLESIDDKPFPNVCSTASYKNFTEISAEDLADISKHSLKKSIDGDMTRRVEIDKSIFSDKLRVPTLTTADVKKSNDMQPYQIQVRLMAVNENNEFVQYMDFIVGVKVNLHILTSEEMIANIQAVLQNKGKFFNFIRWTTGEKSLFKDLLLNINNVKLDVANRSKGTSAWWLKLKRLREEAGLQKAFFAKTKIVPNSTICISSYDYGILKDNFGYDLRVPKLAKELMDALFLMNFMIIDDGRRTIEILYDGATTFQTYALETLEREITLTSNKLGKELTRMIGG